MFPLPAGRASFSRQVFMCFCHEKNFGDFFIFSILKKTHDYQKASHQNNKIFYNSTSNLFCVLIRRQI